MSKDRDVVLILTHTQDYYTVDRVAAALTKRGCNPVRIDTDRFPLDLKLSARFSADGPAGHSIKYQGHNVSQDQVRAVWCRKIWAPQMDESLDPQYRAMCAAESSAMFKGFLDGLHSARWVNSPTMEHAAEDKLYQLRIAGECGLRIPRTLSTNDPDEARAFFEMVNGSAVAKLLRPLSVSMGPAPVFVYTSDVSREDLEQAELLRHSPMVFQEKIPKQKELRIAFVNGRFFIGAIDAARSARGQTDWRRSDPAECKWERDGVPKDVAERLNAFMSRLGLLYGAIDLIRTPAGDHVFLEVNPGGEWGMLERDLDLPISGAIAEALVD